MPKNFRRRISRNTSKRHHTETLELRQLLTNISLVLDSNGLTVDDLSQAATGTDPDGFPFSIPAISNQFTISASADGSSIVISDASSGQFQTTIAGGSPAIVFSNNNRTVTIPTSRITGGTIRFLAGEGDDTLTVNLSNPIPKAIEWDGQIGTSGTLPGSETPGNDRLILSGTSTVASVAHSPSSTSAGSLVVAGSPTISYLGSEQVIDQLIATTRSITFGSGNDTITVSDVTSGDGLTNVASSSSVPMAFANPQQLLTIDGGGGSDTINFNSADSGFNSSLTLLGGTGSDIVNLNAALNLNTGSAGGNLEIAAESIVSSGAVNTNHALTTDGNITFTADSIQITADLLSGSSRITLQPQTAGTLIHLGAADAAGILGLTDAELDFVRPITAGLVKIGNATAGSITIKAPISRPSNAGNVSLETAGSVTQDALAVLALTGGRDLAVRAGTNIDLTMGNQVGDIAMVSTTGSISYSEGSGGGALTVGLLDGVLGVRTVNQPISLSTASGSLTVGNSSAINDVDAGNSTVTLTAVGGFLRLNQFATIRGLLGINAASNNDLIMDSSGGMDAGSSTVRIETLGTRNMVFGSTPVADLELSSTEISRITAGQIDFVSVGTIDVLQSFARTAATDITFSGTSVALNALVNTGGGELVIDSDQVTAAAVGVDANSSVLSFAANTDLRFQIDGTTLDTEYQQLNIVGQIDLTGTTLSLVGTYAPGNADTFVLISNDGTDAVIGEFSNAAQNSIVTVNGGVSKRIVYNGGDGNDVVLEALNQPATDITLTASSIDEGLPSGSLVGLLNAVDPDLGDIHQFDLVEGTGDEGNDFFAIVNNELSTLSTFDFETQDTYSIRVRATDLGGAEFEKVLLISVNNVNENPTVLGLTGSSVAENQPAGTVVGTLSTTDPDLGSTFTYTFVEGTGDTDNSRFTISGDQLQTNEVLNFEFQSSYTVRLRTTDNGGLFVEQAFVITATDVNEVPTDVQLSRQFVQEGKPVASLVGQFAVTDEDLGQTYTYTFVEGEGDQDNNRFTIAGAALLTAEVFDFETQASFSIRVKVTDSGNPELSYEEAFQINVLNNPEGTSLNDIFTVAMNASGISISLKSGTGTTNLVGTYLYSDPGITIFGFGGTDVVNLVGTSESDLIELTSTGLIVNGLVVDLSGIESLTTNAGIGNDFYTISGRLAELTTVLLDGGAGNDTYSIDADGALGTISFSEKSGGIDTLDFSSTSTSVAVNLGVATVQSVNANLSLILGSTSTFDNVTGGSGNDVMSGNSLANRLEGKGGNDQFSGLGGNDTYAFNADTALGNDTLVDSAGVDVLDFSSTVTTGISINLSLTSPQAINTNLSLTLASGTSIEGVSGSQADDVIIGNTLANRLEGNGGNDSLQGAAGNDIYLFNADSVLGQDTLTDATGLETLDFSKTLVNGVTVSLGLTTPQVVNSNLTLTLGSATTFDNLVGSQANDVLTGTSLNNTLTGLGGDDVLDGGSGNDTYMFLADVPLGTDTIIDSAGSDHLNFASTKLNGVTVNLGDNSVQIVNSNLSLQITPGTGIDKITGTAKDDVLTGNSLNNTLTGGTGNDQLFGEAGNDVLNGGAGDDVLDGGQGDDTYQFDADVVSGSDVVADISGTDFFDFKSTTTIGVSVNLGTTSLQVVSPTLSLTLASDASIENITGGSLGDTLIGNSLSNRMIGGPGNDLLQGEAGDDIYSFDADVLLGADTINDSAGLDTIDFTGTTLVGVTIDLGQSGSQVVHASNHSLTLGASVIEKVVGGALNDTITGNSAANLLLGMAGNDTINGLGGNDILIGGAGTDFLFGGDDDDILIAGTTTYDTDASALASIMSIWSDTGIDYETRVAQLRGPTVGVPPLTKGTIVRRDSLSNQLTGGNGRDWFFANTVGTGLLDILLDQDSGLEFLDEL